MEKFKNQSNGISLISLVITIIVLIILGTITINSGSKMIKKVKLEELRTNMLLIQGKAKEYVEEANFKMGINPDEEKKASVRTEVYETQGKLKVGTSVSSDLIPSEIPVSECYVLDEDTFNDWGLDKIDLDEDEYYLVKFDEANEQVEVYNSLGYNGVYSLTEIDSIEE